MERSARGDIHHCHKHGVGRLTELDVVLTNPFDNIGAVAGIAGEHLQGTGAAAISQEMVSNSRVVQTGVMLTYNDSKGSSTKVYDD